MAAIETFFAMGGYAGFIWPAYAVAAAVLVGLLVASLRTLRRREAALATLRGETETGSPTAKPL